VSRLFARGIVHFVSDATDMVIDYFAQSICHAEWPVLRESMPGRKGEVFARTHFGGSYRRSAVGHESWPLYERRLRLRPCDSRILYIHAGSRFAAAPGIPMQASPRCSVLRSASRKKIMSGLMGHRVCNVFAGSRTNILPPDGRDRPPVGKEPWTNIGTEADSKS